MFSFVIAVAMSLAQPAVSPLGEPDTPFAQESSQFYTTAHGLPSNQVSAVALTSDGTPLVATPMGLAGFMGAQWHGVSPDPGFRVDGVWVVHGAVWVAGQGQLARLEARKDGVKLASPESGGHLDLGNWSRIPWPSNDPIVALVGLPDRVVAAAGHTLYEVLPQEVRALTEVPEAVDALSATVDGIFVGTNDNLYRLDAANLTTPVPVMPQDDRYSWKLRNVAGLANVAGRLWFAADNGVGMLADGRWRLYTGREGLPYDQFSCATPGEGQVVWFGTSRGAIRYDGDRWAYRASKRWLPDDHVTCLAVQADGTAWIGTREGLSRIDRKNMTLAEKAANFERIIDERHRRLDFIIRCQFETLDDLSTSSVRESDNDGLYTAMYGTSQALRYAATKDPEAKQRAERCLKGLKLLFDVTGIPGFPARSVLPVATSEDPNKRFGAAANAAQKKEDPLWKDILPRWPKSADGKYYWKCDTSSDEICGHYIFYATYYDYVAETEEEKAVVRDIVKALSDHIVDHNFCLVDHDGLPTRWANWGIDYTNSLKGWADRGLQAVEILSFMNVAHHITGDTKFLDAAKMLRDKYAYHINAIYGRITFPPNHVVPWDNNLSFLSYYGLLKYENDPELRETYRLSIERNWLFVSRMNDPFFNFMYASMVPDPRNPEAVAQQNEDKARAVFKGIQTLRDTPLLLIGHQMNNSHRLDVTLDTTPRQKKGMGAYHNGEAIPVNERSHIRINSDHFALDHGQGPLTEYEGTFYLLPYYLGLYSGFIK